MVLPRFDHLLVPLDFTTKNVPALDIAFEIASQNEARVTLLHVIETIETDSDQEMQQFYNRLEARADRELEDRSQRFAEAGLAVDSKVRFGKRLPEIIQDAEDRKSDLIVMSSHPVDPEQPLESWGTLSYQVSLLCTCPVLLVK